MEIILIRSEEHTSELQSPCNRVCRLLLEKKKRHAIGATFDGHNSDDHQDGTPQHAGAISVLDAGLPSHRTSLLMTSVGILFFFFLIIRRPPRSTLFPYTTLFRSGAREFCPADRAETIKEEMVLVILDRKSTRLNSSHLVISYAVFCLKKKQDD